MKKITALIFFVLAIACSTGYAQDKAKMDTLKANAKVNELIDRTEHSVGKPYELNSAIIDLGEAMIRRIVDSEIRQDAAKRLIRIYNSLGDSGIDVANKNRILEAIGNSDNSLESHRIFLSALDSDNTDIRMAALRNINARGMHGDDIYEKIYSLKRKGILSESEALINLGKANPSRGVKEMSAFLRTTPSLREFVGVALNLPDGYYDDPNTLDVIIDRYSELKVAPPYDKQSVGYTPDRAISSKYLWKYIDAREGERLNVALTILKDKGVCGESNLPQLIKKISSNNPLTRLAVATFLESQVFSRNLTREKVSPIIENARNEENDPKLRRKLKEILTAINARRQQ